MLTQFAFPEWTPDLANNVMVTAKNVRAIANGYAPIKGPISATTTLTGAGFYGGGAFIASDGSTTLFASNEAGILRKDGPSWAAVSSFDQVMVNRFAQFGDHVVISRGGGNGPVFWNMLTNTTAPANDTPPVAIDVARVRDFVMVITEDNKVQWSQFNDCLSWTTGTNQADYQPILDSQGVRLVGGEYGILLKKQGITRISYVGSAGGLIFQFDEIAPEIGCMAAGSVSNVGRLIFFLSERGFMLCDGNDVTPIGDEKFNRWFFDSFSREDIENIWSAIDPRNSTVYWAMPGFPGTILAYNWVLKRATVIECEVNGLFTGYSTGTSLEALDAIYGDLDSIDISLDSPSLQGGSPALILVNMANELSSLEGETLEAVLEVANVEPTPGRRSRIRSLRLVSDTTDASVTVDSRMRAGDAEFQRSTATMRSNGKLPIRANGRYNSMAVTIPAGTDWTFAQALEIEFEPGDGR